MSGTCSSFNTAAFWKLLESANRESKLPALGNVEIRFHIALVGIFLVDICLRLWYLVPGEFSIGNLRNGVAHWGM